MSEDTAPISVDFVGAVRAVRLECLELAVRWLCDEDDVTGGDVVKIADIFDRWVVLGEIPKREEVDDDEEPIEVGFTPDFD